MNRGLVPAGVEGADDIGMPHPCQHPHFDEKTLEQNFIVVCGCLQYLDGHRPAHQHVLAAIDDAHAADTDALKNAIIADRRVDRCRPPTRALPGNW